MSAPLPRRRFLRILASSIGGLSGAALLRATGSRDDTCLWRGYTLGAEGTIRLHAPASRARAEAALERCFREMRRLESLFSLYDARSELSRLNRDGRLRDPDPAWHDLLAACDRAHRLTEGRFDPTIQPIWETLTRLAAAAPSPTPAAIAEATAEARARTGWHKLVRDRCQIAFTAPGMRLTLNGIAQGFITDRITQLLREAGFHSALVELGETRALGTHPEGRPWRLGIRDARTPGALFDTVHLADGQALATSGAYGTPLTPDGRLHHLIDPRSGLPQTAWRSLSVLAPTATEADALSTGAIFLSPDSHARLRAARPDLRLLAQA